MSNKFKAGDKVRRISGDDSHEMRKGELYEVILAGVWRLCIKGIAGKAFHSDNFELVEDKDKSIEPDGLDDGKKYVKTIYGLCGTPVEIDVYRVLDAYPTEDSAMDHLIKKALNAGNRGHKDKITDYKNIEESARKARILLEQKMTHEEQ